MADEYTDEDMAAVGRSLMDVLPDGYVYGDSPAEIVTDLQNEIYDDLRHAQRLAVALHEKHFKRDASVGWKVADDLLVVIDQIENMTTDMVRRSAI